MSRVAKRTIVTVEEMERMDEVYREQCLEWMKEHPTEPPPLFLSSDDVLNIEWHDRI